MRYIVISIIFCLVIAHPSLAAVITQWDFNGIVATTSTASGSGTISLVGGTTTTFASGQADGGSSDPSPSIPPDFAFNTGNYPSVGGNETAGVQFLVSTAGYSNIRVTFDQRQSEGASRYWAVYYTIDGVAWNRLFLNAINAAPGTTPAAGTPANTNGLFGATGTFSGFSGSIPGAGDDWFNGRMFDLSTIPGVNDNTNFGFRILSSFDGNATYSSSSSLVYASIGTARYDMVTITGSAIPEPSIWTTLGVTGVGCLGFFRLRTSK